MEPITSHDRADRSPRIWFVTGCSSGFGHAIGEAVLDNGDCLVATSRDPQSIDALVDKHPDRAVALGLDVTDPEDCRRAVRDAVTRFGRIDVVVNNAGYGLVGAAEELSEQDLRRQFDVNLFGVVNVTRAALPQLREQRSGQLVQMSSLNGVEGLVGGSYYAASKFAVEGFSESLADEVQHLGIGVTIVEPGPHRTNLLSDPPTDQETAEDEYAESVGKVRELLRQLDGAQPGDPDRAARAIIQAVESDQPPRRLPLGQMAVDNIRHKLTTQLDELETWAKLSVSSDFPAAQAATAQS
jgi:NAD(P)-dependent dehydrogenase (short-subunit alcohol dehydrogenase family)